MHIKLSEIDGLMVEKRIKLDFIDDTVTSEEICQGVIDTGFNEALTEQGNKEITLSRERFIILDEVIQKVLNKEFSLDVTPYEVICMRNSIADAIRADIKNIIEVKKEG